MRAASNSREPWAVEIWLGPAFLCSGAVIGPDYVLTSNHGLKTAVRFTVTHPSSTGVYTLVSDKRLSDADLALLKREPRKRGEGAAPPPPLALAEPLRVTHGAEPRLEAELQILKPRAIGFKASGKKAEYDAKSELRLTIGSIPDGVVRAFHGGPGLDPGMSGGPLVVDVCGRPCCIGVSRLGDAGYSEFVALGPWIEALRPFAAQVVDLFPAADSARRLAVDGIRRALADEAAARFAASLRAEFKVGADDDRARLANELITSMHTDAVRTCKTVRRQPGDFPAQLRLDVLAWAAVGANLYRVVDGVVPSSGPMGPELHMAGRDGRPPEFVPQRTAMGLVWKGRFAIMLPTEIELLTDVSREELLADGLKEMGLVSTAATKPSQHLKNLVEAESENLPYFVGDLRSAPPPPAGSVFEARTIYFQASEAAEPVLVHLAELTEEAKVENKKRNKKNSGRS